jgi:hypothetical protein
MEEQLPPALIADKAKPFLSRHPDYRAVRHHVSLRGHRQRGRTRP